MQRRVGTSLEIDPFNWIFEILLLLMGTDGSAATVCECKRLHLNGKADGDIGHG
jgi:hypothetical protein